MTTVGLRTYSVSPVEFPIEIEVTAVKLPANRAIVGHPRVARAGVLLERIVPVVVEDPARFAFNYKIAMPAAPPGAFDITQSIDCWFTDDCPSDARYQIVITTASGDEVVTNVRVPTLNPGAANLAFRVA
jgi:hypothetical protein